MPAPLNLVGQRYGRLLVIGPRERRKGQTLYTCRCDCGTVKAINSYSLRRGLTISCGCFRTETTVARSTSHGQGGRGAARTPEFNVWAGIRRRCENTSGPDYPRYGGRGIVVCERWSSFEAFFADMGSRPTATHSIERINNDGPYAPENCRWATKREQANNTRQNRHLTLDGVTRTLAEWSRETGLDVHTIGQRLRLDWSVEQALRTPLLRQSRRGRSSPPP